MDLARILFALGATPFAAFGLLHALGALADVRHPRWFTPRDDRVRSAMAGTAMVFTDRTDMWRAWLGFNISHGLGVFLFGALCLLLAARGFRTGLALRPPLPAAIAVALRYFLLAPRLWFYAPAIRAGLGAACFIACALLL